MKKNLHKQAETPCPLCGNDAVTKSVAENTIFGSPFDIAYCGECELYFFSTMPSTAFLDIYYAQDYFAEFRENNLKYRLKSLFSAMRARSQFIYISAHTEGTAGKRILEMGSADGTFLSYFKSAGYEVRGLETSEYMTSKAIEKFGISLEHLHITDINPDKHCYDIIALPHVIEHLTDPAGILSHCKSLLAPGGIVFIEAPYSPLPEEASSEELAFYLETTHLYNFRPRSISKLVAESGLEMKTLDRFFYPVPDIFRSSGKSVGHTLMCGSFADGNYLNAAPLTATIAAMLKKHLSKSNPLMHISFLSPWRGLGDSLRVVAG